MSKAQAINDAINYFDEGFACSQSVLLAFANKFDLDQKTAKLISSTFGGGMGRLRQKCGALTGGFMVLGLAYGNADPKDMETKIAAYNKVQELNQKFENTHGTSICSELLKKHVTESDVKERKHHQLICRKLVGDTAGLLYEIISENESK